LLKPWSTKWQSIHRTKILSSSRYTRSWIRRCEIEQTLQLRRSENWPAKSMEQISYRLKLSSMFELVDKRLTKFEPYPTRSGNRLVLIRSWHQDGLEYSFKATRVPFAAWQCVFLLRSKTHHHRSGRIRSYDPDFAWFRNEALRRLTAFVLGSLAVGVRQTRDN